MSIFSKLRDLFPKKKHNKGKKGKKSSANYPSYRKVSPKTGFKACLKRFILKSVLYGTLAVSIVLGILFFTLPSIGELNKLTKAQSILIKSEDGQIIGSFGDIYGDYIKYSEFPKSLRDAVIATEDRNFYHHFGVDPLGLLRASIANFRAGHVVQGGSTITQQVAKNVFLTSEKSYLRKLKEMLLAFKLEANFSKKEILSIYLNRVYLGAGSYGVDAAAKRYFGKSARDLTVSESAIMAGLLKAPSRYAPTSNPELSLKRADQVLVNMEDADYLTKPETDKARKELANSMKNRKANSQSSFYFSDWIMDQLPEYIGNAEEDLIVITTLKPNFQNLAEKSLTEVMDKNAEKMKASQASMLAMSPDGAVRVMLGGRSYAESQYNRATQSQRQPGSSFKMFVYLAGMEAGMNPDTVFDDTQISVPISGGTWRPQNYTHKYNGEMTLRQALSQSINSIAVQISEQVGRDRVITAAKRLGITTDMQPVPSIALGATEVSLLELTNAYAHLASGGQSVTPYGIIEVRTTKGRLIYKRSEPRRSNVIDTNVVGMMNDMLMSVVNDGTAKGAKIGRPVAGKTGTTSDYKDAWFIGYTPDLVAGVWVGNDDNDTMKKVTGGTLPVSIWKKFMADALAGTAAKDLPTGGGWLANAPWNGGGQSDATTSGNTDNNIDTELDTENSVETAPENRPETKAPTRKKQDVELGDSFWQKLDGAR